jgi:hypothetical protein
MRAALGFAAVHAVFALPGIALLHALGLVSRLRQVPAALGPGYFCGLAAVLPVLIALLVAGMTVGLAQFLAVSLGLTAALGAVGLWRRPEPDMPAAAAPAAGVDVWLSRAVVAALVLFFVVGATAFANLPTDGDDWGIWSYKALALFEFGDLHPGLFDGTQPGPGVPGHPILQPLLESLFFRAMAGPFLQEWHVALWIIFATFVWTAAWLMRTRGTGAVALVPLAILALTARSRGMIALGFADVTVAAFLAAGALAIGLWLDSGRGRYALLGGVFLAAAANTKNEGAAAAVAILLVAAAVVHLARLRAWRALIPAGAVTAAGFAAWSWWRADHHIDNPDLTPFGDALDWTFLTDRLDLLSSATGRMFLQLANQGDWSWLVPCFLALAIACLVQGLARRVAAFYLATAGLMMLSLIWVYWTAATEDGTLLRVSADRVGTGVVFVCAVGAVHLIASVIAPARDDQRKVR